MSTEILKRIDNMDWDYVHQELNTYGCIKIENFLNAAECKSLITLYEQNNLFRKKILLENHGFGKGEYQYFDYPLPDLITRLRGGFYSQLSKIANEWNIKLGKNHVYPNDLQGYLDECHKVGQQKATPLMLKYVEGDYNCLHQDLYGEMMFPLQVVCMLSEYETDFLGGEFVMTEQRPRMQSRPEVFKLNQGDIVIFAVQQRPHHGAKGIYRVNMKHGVSKIRKGIRHTLGIIFHDAS